MSRFRNTGQPDRGWWSELWPDPEGTLRKLGLEEGDVVADVCCGDGYFSLPAAGIASEVYGVDIDESLLESARDRAEAEGLDNVEFFRGDARELSALLPERVDFALLANTFHGVEDREGLGLQIFSSLRQGGRFALVNWRDLPREETTVLGETRGPPTELRMSPGETERSLETVPFRGAEVVDIPPYHHGVVFEK